MTKQLWGFLASQSSYFTRHLRVTTYGFYTISRASELPRKYYFALPTAPRGLLANEYLQKTEAPSGTAGGDTKCSSPTGESIWEVAWSDEARGVALPQAGRQDPGVATYLGAAHA